MPGSCLGIYAEEVGCFLIAAISSADRFLYPEGSFLNCALWMPSTNSFFFKGVGLAYCSPWYGRNADVRSPQMVRRQSLMLCSFIFLPVFLARKVSKNCSDEV